MLRKLFRNLLQRWARQRLSQRIELQFGAGTQIDIRRIAQRPPRRLVIGENSIFLGSIAADRPSAEVIIGARTFIGASTLVTAERILIGDDVLISWGCTIVDHDSHALRWEDRKNDVTETLVGRKDWSQIKINPVSIGNRAWIGFNVIILEGVTVGEGAVIGAGSVVTRDVAPYTVIAGNPAKVVRTLGPDER